MNKYFFITLLLLITSAAWAQKKVTRVQVIRSESAHNIKKDGKDLLIVYKAVFQQDNTVLSSDSAYFYTSANAIDAFGHVLITQGDTLNIFGDKLNYQGNTKIAIMTDNVRMIDKDATLTTNLLTYNTATKYGTYTGGGKLVNKDNTLTSKNGYYFASTRDAYFRYNVVLNTVDAIIKTDTLRYNSGSRIAFFYGPTNIYGKKDKDTLYTENGTYNTQTEQAFFGKKNLWKQKTKSLKGDSLFYDRLIGYGKAVKHVTFTDTEQKITLKGGLGEYFKAGEKTLMTIHPYVIFVTEEKKDTTKKDSAKAITTGVNKQTLLARVPIHSMPIIDSAQIKAARVAAQKATVLTPPKKSKPIVDSVKLKADKNIKVIKEAIPIVKKDTTHIKRDSIFFGGDTIETQILTYKDLKELKEERRIAAAALQDTSIKIIHSKLYTKPVKYIEIVPLRLAPDTAVFHRNYFAKARLAVKKDTTQRKLISGSAPKKPSRGPSMKKKVVAGIDSVNLSPKITLSDTARIRILSAYHHAKIFKSDLQAKADSIFFSYSDSIARMYVKPMMWVQNSQLSGDTINLQMKRKQLDNLEMFPSGFIVNVEKRDSVHFNQVGGKKMRGFFKNSKLDRVFVDGNAETIYFERDSLRVTQMHRTISSKIRVNFKDNEAMDVTWFVKPDARYVGINKVKDDDKVLKGFLWKPKDRPVSKESIISPAPIVPAATEKKPGDKTVANKKAPAKDDVKTLTRPGAMKLKTDSVKLKTDTLQHIKLKADSIKMKPAVIKLKTDSVKTKTDTTKTKKQHE